MTERYGFVRLSLAISGHDGFRANNQLEKKKVIHHSVKSSDNIKCTIGAKEPEALEEDCRRLRRRRLRLHISV